MLSATLLYARKGAVCDTHWPFRNSCVGSASLPAGPVPLMPNRLLSLVASRLWPQPDSTMACAIVTAAGTPYRLCAAGGGDGVGGGWYVPAGGAGKAAACGCDAPGTPGMAAELCSAAL